MRTMFFLLISYKKTVKKTCFFWILKNNSYLCRRKLNIKPYGNTDKPPMMKKCICFSRVSSSAQDLTAQRKEVYEAAILRKYKDSEILEVKGKESAIKLKEEQRQTLNEMKQLVEENPTIETIIFFAVDRLARRMSIVLSIYEWATEEKGINLVFLNPYPMETMFKKEGKMVVNGLIKQTLSLMAFAAEMEMKVKNERFQAAKKYLKEKGFNTGKLSYGYTSDDDGKIIINKDEAKIVNWVFRSYLSGKASVEIFDEGVELGYWKSNARKYKSLRSQKVLEILKNKVYIGEPTATGIVCPSIIEIDDFEKAKAIMNERKKTAPRKSKNMYYAKGKVYDKNGFSLIADVGRNIYRSKYSGIEVNINVVEFLTWRVAYFAKWNKLTTNNVETELAEARKQLDTISSKIIIAKDILEKEINPKYEALEELYLSGRTKMNRDKYNERYDEIEKEEKKLTTRIAELERKEIETSNIITTLQNKQQRDISIYEIMGIEDDNERKEIIDEVIERVVIDKTDRKTWWIQVHYPAFTSPSTFKYISHGGTKKEIYEVIGDVELDISSEFVPRFKQQQKNK